MRASTAPSAAQWPTSTRSTEAPRSRVTSAAGFQAHILRQAPVVRAHREVIEQAVDAGKIEVEHRAQPPALEQRVVAEQIGVHRAARQVGKTMLRLVGDLVFQQLVLTLFQEAFYFLKSDAPPLRPARVLEVDAVGAAGEVHAAEQHAELAALRGARTLERFARQPRDQRRRLAVQRLQVAVVQVGDRGRARDAVAREMRHQAEVERQLLRRQPLEQRQDVAALRGVDEIIGVLDAGLDRRDLLQPADRVVAQPVGELRVADLGVNRQAVSRK